MIYGITGKKQSGKNTIAKIWQFLDEYYSDKYYHLEKFGSDIEFVLRCTKVFSLNAMSSWQQKSFAYKLKQIVCILTGCTMEQLENEEFKNSSCPDNMKFWRIVYFDNSSDAKLINFKIFKTKEEAITEYNKLDNLDLTVEDPELYLPTYRELLQYIGTDLFREQLHPDIWINSLFNEYESIPYRESKDCGQYSNIYPNWLVTDVRFLNEAKAIKDRNGKIIKIERNIDNKDNHQSETEIDKIEYDYLIDNNDSIEELITKVKKIMIKENIINN